MATLQENVAARKAARQAGVPIVNAAPAPVATVDQSQLRVNPRRAEEVAAQQNAQHLNALSQNQGTVQSYIDPTTGRDTRFTYDANGVRSEQMTSAGTLGTFNTQGPIGTNFSDIGDPSGVSTRMTRDAAGAPLDPRSGAMGQTGATGYGNISYGDQGINLDNEFRMIDEKAANDIANLSPSGGVSREDVERNAQMEKENLRRDAESQANIQASKAAEETARIQGKTTETPQGAGASAAFANLPPEAQFLAPFLQEFQGSIQQSMQENQQMTQGLLDKTQKGYDSIDQQLSGFAETYKATTEAMQGMLEEARDQNEESIAKQEQAAKEQLAWQDLQQRRTITKQKAEAHDNMVVQIALAGGFAQDAGLRAVMESDAEFDSRMDELAVNLGFARTDLAAKFSGLYMENRNNYTNATVQNTKDALSAMERIGMQSIANQQAKQTAEREILTSAWDRQVNLRNDLAKTNLSIAGEISGMIRQDKIDKISAEDKALEKIDYLLSNYPRESVAEAITELGKNVTSFNVQALIDNPTLDEVKRAEAARAKSRSGVGGAGFSSGLIPTPSIPTMSFEEFASQKISAMEEEELASFSADKRAQVKSDNEEIWRSEYERISAPSFDQLPSSGNYDVDLLAKAVLDGTQPRSGLRLAAKESGVPLTQVLSQIDTLSTSGYVPDFPTLTPDQSTRYLGIDKTRRQNPLYQKAADAISGYSNIKGQQPLGTGASQIAIINTFQGQLVDPGATVRAEDIAVMRSATALLDSIDPKFLIKRIKEGQLVPQSLINQIVQSSEAIVDMRVHNYNDVVLPEFQKQADLVGVPSRVFEPLSKGSVIVDSIPESSTYFDYDSFLEEQGYGE